MGGGGGGEGEGGGGSHAEAEGGTCGLSGMRRAAERGMGTPPFAMSGLARVRAHAHALAHTRTRTHTHTRIRARMHARVCTPAPANTHAHACPRTQAHARTHTHTHTHRTPAREHVRACARTRVQHAHTHARDSYCLGAGGHAGGTPKMCNARGGAVAYAARAPHTGHAKWPHGSAYHLSECACVCVCWGARCAGRFESGSKRLASPQQPNVYLEPKWLR